MSDLSLHHVAVHTRDLDRSLRFYTEGLGCREVLRFPEDGDTVVLLQLPGGGFIELFGRAPDADARGALPHFALRTADCDAALERARRAGGTPAEPPTDMMLHGDRDVPVRYAFCQGPSGERIELIEIPELGTSGG